VIWKSTCAWPSPRETRNQRLYRGVQAEIAQFGRQKVREIDHALQNAAAMCIVPFPDSSTPAECRNPVRGGGQRHA
jgi:hypothetical protein